MSQDRQRTLFRVCCTELHQLKNKFQETNYEYSKEEAAAWNIVIEKLVDLAAAAALRGKVPEERVRVMVEMVNDMCNHLKQKIHVFEREP